MGGGAARGGAGWGLQGGPAHPGLAFVQGRRDGKEWDIPWSGYSAGELLGAALLLLTSPSVRAPCHIPGLSPTLAIWWTHELVKFPATSDPALPPIREPCSRLLILSLLMSQSSSFLHGPSLVAISILDILEALSVLPCHMRLSPPLVSCKCCLGILWPLLGPSQDLETLAGPLGQGQPLIASECSVCPGEAARAGADWLLDIVQPSRGHSCIGTRLFLECTVLAAST